MTVIWKTGLSTGTARRNHDEIRFWSDYITPGAGDYIYDDEGNFGGLPEGSCFVIAGDYNADPFDGDSVDGAAQILLGNPLIDTSVTPASRWCIGRCPERRFGQRYTHRQSP